MPFMRYLTVMVICAITLTLYHCNAEAADVNRKYCWAMNGDYNHNIRGLTIPCLTEKLAIFETIEDADTYHKEFKTHVGQTAAWINIGVQNDQGRKTKSVKSKN